MSIITFNLYNKPHGYYYPFLEIRKLILREVEAIEQDSLRKKNSNSDLSDFPTTPNHSIWAEIGMQIF